MQKNLKRKRKRFRHLSSLSCPLEFFKWYAELLDLHSKHQHKFSLVAESHNMGFGDFFKGLQVFRAVNNLHMFTLFIRTESIRGLRKAEICELYEPLFPPLTCSCSLLQLSSGIYVNVPTIKHKTTITTLSFYLLCLCTQLLKHQMLELVYRGGLE